MFHSLFQDSNARGRGYGDGVKETIDRELKQLRKTHGLEPEDIQFEFYPTYHLGPTYRKILETNHQDAIVIICLGVNNVRWDKGTGWTHYGIKDQRGHVHHGYMKKIIDHLKGQTHPSNIVIMETPPSTKYSMYNFNKASYFLCKNEGIGFAHTLVAEQHLWRDEYHIRDDHRHLLVKSVAAAILAMEPFGAYGRRLH